MDLREWEMECHNITAIWNKCFMNNVGKLNGGIQTAFTSWSIGEVVA